MRHFMHNGKLYRVDLKGFASTKIVLEVFSNDDIWTHPLHRELVLADLFAMLHGQTYSTIWTDDRPLVAPNDDKPHRCPNCHAIPDAAYEHGKAVPGYIYVCRKADCGVKWRAP